MTDTSDVTGAPIAALRHLLEGDGRPALRWLTDVLRGAESSPGLDDAVLSEVAAVADAVLASADGWSEESSRRAHRCLPLAMRAAAEHPCALPVFLLYIRHVCEQAWELTWNHAAMHDVIDVVTDARTSDVGMFARNDGAQACARLVEFLRREFAVESAMLTGALGALHATVTAAHRDIEDIVENVKAESADWPLRALVLEEAESEEVYFACLDTATVATRRYLRREIETVAPAIATLEGALAGPALRAEDASEIRSHLAALDALEAARDRPWLQVTEGCVVVLYPFSLRAGRSDVSGQVVTQALADGGTWTLGGLAPTEPPKSSLAVSDAWQGDDALGRHFRGTELVLPDLELRQHVPRLENGTGEAMIARRIGVKVQFSALGNHVVRFEVDIADAGPGDLAEAISIASPVYGDLFELDGMVSLVRADAESDTRTQWSRLATVAEDMIQSVATRFDSDSDMPTKVSARRGMFTVISVIHRARVFEGVADAVGVEMKSARLLPDLFGAQPLVHPMPGGATSVADWSSYDLDELRRYSLLTLNDELLAANANTALLASFRSPAYAISTVRSYVEFAHSLQGMYAGWNDEVAGHAQEIAARLDEVDDRLKESLDSVDARGADALQATLVSIERAELRLQRFLQGNQATMLFIESPSLVTSAALRLDLDTVLESSGYTALRMGFMDAKNEVLGNRLQELLAIASRRISDRLEQDRARQAARNRRILDAVAVGIGVIGLSGLISVLQGGYSLKGWPSAVFVGVLSLLAIVFMAFSWRASGERSERARRRRWSRRRKPEDESSA